MENKNLKLFAQMLSEEIKKPAKVEEQIQEHAVEETVNEETTADQISKYLSRKNKTDAPEVGIEKQRWDDPLRPLDQNFVTVKEMNDHYSLFLKRIQQQMSTMSGGGEVNFRGLDDVDSSTIGENRHLAYRASDKKFFFEPVQSGEQIQSDWSETNTDAADFILNKPTNLSDFNNDSGFITSADGGNADLLDGEEGSYYLDYNNFTNTPAISDYGDSDVDDYLKSGTITEVLFDTTHTDTDDPVGTFCWNALDDTFNIQHSNGVRQQVGQEQYAYARNNTGTVIPNGTVVRFDGAETVNGEARLEVAPLLADGIQPGLYTVGVSTEEIANGDDGRITVLGKVREINTTGSDVGETWAVGDILYVSPDNVGNFTKVKPTAPNNVTPIAAVLRVDATEGELFVRPTIEQKKSYGRFARTTNFTFDASDTAYALDYDTTEITNGATLGVDDSIITVDQSGFYQVDINLQADAGGGGFSSAILYTWLRINGVDLANSTRRQGILGSAPSSTFSYTLAISLAEGDELEIMVASSSTNLVLDSAAATSFAPATASALISVTQVQL